MNQKAFVVPVLSCLGLVLSAFGVVVFPSIGMAVAFSMFAGSYLGSGIALDIAEHQYGSSNRRAA